MSEHTDIVLNYRFRVLIDNIVVAFSKISGLGMSRETEILSDGGNSLGGHMSPVVSKGPGTLRLERGVISKDTGITGKLRPGIYLSNGIVILVKGNKNKTLIKYGTGPAYVTKWEISDLDAEQGGVLVNTFEIAYTEFAVLK